MTFIAGSKKGDAGFRDGEHQFMYKEDQLTFTKIK